MFFFLLLLACLFGIKNIYIYMSLSYLQMREKKIHYKDINVFITCSLCNGYLIDAATIPECLHTCMYLIILIC
jgi:hypothetical protein